MPQLNQDQGGKINTRAGDQVPLFLLILYYSIKLCFMS